MKKILLVLYSVLVTLNAMAADTKMVTFEMLDGTRQSIASTNLVISFADGKLNATDGNTSLSLPMNALRAFYFGSQSGVTDILTAENQAVEAFTVAGVHQGTFQSLEDAKAVLQTGLFILKSGKETIKVVVK